VTVEADYVVSKDGIVLGIIRPFKKMRLDEDSDVMRERVFALVVSATEKTLTVKDVECKREKVEELIQGTYKKATGKVTCKIGSSPGKTNGKAKGHTAPGAVIGGCVGAAAGATMGHQVPCSGLTLPSPRYLEHPPQYMPETPQCPLPHELSQTEEEQPSNTLNDRSAESSANPLPAVLDILRKWGLLQDNPTRRMDELINQSENVRRLPGVRHPPVIDPSDLKYDRIHGSIE
jgi:hypothetical protein